MPDQREREYGEFVEARLDRLRRFAYLLCGDWHLAEDAVQTAPQRATPPLSVTAEQAIGTAPTMYY